MSNEARSTKTQRFAWCLYDFGNSAYPTVIITAVYGVYFKSVVVGEAEPGRGDQLWGGANALGALFVFALAPFLGALADRWRLKRTMLWAHAWLCAGATACLAATGPGSVALAFALIVVSLYAFEAANVFYNAYLPELVEKARMPSLSGRAWAFGYVGGLLSLLLVVLLIKAGVGVPWVPLVVAGWFLVFTLPTLCVLKDRPLDRAAAPGPRGTTVLTRLKSIGKHRSLLRFLLALFFYMNGVNTVIVFAAVFATTSLGFTLNESIVLVMMLNLIAAPGALWFGRLAERHGARHSIVISLLLWLVVIGGAVLAAWPGLFEATPRKVFFWFVAALASLCIGATQATSRTFVGQLAPPGMSGEFFGFMAFAGRASAVLGPWVFGNVSLATGGDQRWAVLSMGGFFAVGLWLLLSVPEPRAEQSSAAG